MSTPTRDPQTSADYESLEGLDAPGVHVDISAEDWRRDRARREWMMIGLGLACLIAVMAIIFAVFAFTGDDDRPAPRAPPPRPPRRPPRRPRGRGADAGRRQGHRVREVREGRPDAAGGAAPARSRSSRSTSSSTSPRSPRTWRRRRSGASPSTARPTAAPASRGPMVVTEGDTVDFTLVNGSTKAMKVTMPHSMDFHSAEVNPGKRYADLAPGKSMHYRFVAKHPGVFMYHCATQPVLMHTGMGMVGMFVVKPKNLAPVDKELWMTQQEYYLGKPGKGGDMAKMQAKKPDVIAFNGYANQYKDNPITVKKGERVRHVRPQRRPEHLERLPRHRHRLRPHRHRGPAGRDSQTMNLAPSQGGWAEFTLDEEGSYPFVTHAFGDAGKGAIGVLQTTHAPKAAGGPRHGRLVLDGRGEGRRRRHARRHVGQVQRPDRQGRQGHLRRQERRRHDARPRDRSDAGEARGRHGRPRGVRREGRRPRRRRLGDRLRRLSSPATTS